MTTLYLKGGNTPIVVTPLKDGETVLSLLSRGVHVSEENAALFNKAGGVACYPLAPARQWYVSDKEIATFSPNGGLSLKQAISMLNCGGAFSRPDWAERGEWVALSPPRTVIVNGMTLHEPAWLGMKRSNDTFSPWTPSKEDDVSTYHLIAANIP